jgi:UDP-2,4-diacetamido-2,4,6-trideoxy-beta-L-altropyranose hydrolase
VRHRFDVLIRCDASDEIGKGHVARCYALAHALLAQRVEPGFAMYEGNVDRFPVVRLSASAGCVTAEDVSETAAAAHAAEATWVIVDHYGADQDYLASLRAAGLHVGVIDDHTGRDLRSAEWLLDQNVHDGSADYHVDRNCVLVLGLDYALLRPRFEAARAEAQQRQFSSDDVRVLITLGGGNVTAPAKRMVRGFEAVERRVKLRVLGAAGRPSSRHAIEVRGRRDDMPAEMLWADVAVTAGGSTCWELMCMGVPMVVAPLDESQRRNARAIDELGAGVAVERLEDAGAVAARLLADPVFRAQASRRGMALVDGNGAERAAVSLAALVRGVAHAAG